MKRYEQGAFPLDPYLPFIELIVQSLYSRITLDTLQACKISQEEFSHLLAALSTFPSLQHEVDYMKGILSANVIEPRRTNAAA